MNTCCLIASPDGRIPLAAAQFARLRAMRTQLSSVAELGLTGLPMPHGTLIAMRFTHLERLPAAQRLLLQRFVQNGAVLYVRGGFGPGTHCSLRPFADGDLRVSVALRASAYHCAAAKVLPKALHYELANGEFTIPGAETTERLLEPLLLAHHSDGVSRPAILALACGSGWVIFDLHPDDSVPSAPIVARLSDPGALPAAVGAMIATDLAAGRDMQRPAAFNLIIDDRPANLDYFNARHLTRFLTHLRARCPAVHIDFAWTPDQTRPDPRYIEILRQFNSGFVWHGLLRHVDHRSINDASAELAKGQTIVQELVRRYGVAFQRIMVFPFEKSTLALLRLLAESGFAATVESVDESRDLYRNGPSYLRFSTSVRTPEDPLPVLHRYSCKSLTRRRLLALAILGNPIIAAAHPGDVSLGRLSGIVSRRGSFNHFDTVLEFAAAKHLRALSLEQIATEVSLCHGDDVPDDSAALDTLPQRQGD